MILTSTTIAFFVMSVFTLGGGFGVVTTKNMVHAALYLILSLFGMAGLYILLEASFLAAVQVLVYIGAIAILITITVMVTRRIMGAESVNKQWPVSALVAALLAATFGFVVTTQFGDVVSPAADVPADTIANLGFALANPSAYFLPFEVASVLLLAALIGSIFVARD